MSRWLKYERNRLMIGEVTANVFISAFQTKSMSQRSENNFRTGRPTIPMISVDGDTIS